MRAARTALLVLVLGVALLWAIPRMAPRLVGDRFFLREEFFHPAAYRAGGLGIGSVTIGGTAVDCSGLRRPRPRNGGQVLANPGLDGPCGWGFAPSLGGRARKRDTAPEDGYFRLAAGEGFIFQDVSLAALAPRIGQGGFTLTVAGRCRASGAARAEIVVETYEDDVVGAGPFGTYGAGREGGGEEWGGCATTAELSPGTRKVRVILRGAGRGTASFDEVTATLRRTLTVPSLGLP